MAWRLVFRRSRYRTFKVYNTDFVSHPAQVTICDFEHITDTLPGLGNLLLLSFFLLF